MSSTAFGPGMAGGVPLAILDTEEVGGVRCCLHVVVRCREEGMLLAVPAASVVGTPHTYQVKNKKKFRCDERAPAPKALREMEAALSLGVLARACMALEKRVSDIK